MITLVGVDRLLATFASKTVAGYVAVEAGKDAMGRDVLNEARARVPVLTGNLRDSLAYQSGPVARVYTDVVYAGEVEFGGLHNPPEPYMRPAADLVNPEIPAGVMKAVFDAG